MTQEVDFHGAVAGYVGHLIAAGGLTIGCTACADDLSVQGTPFHLFVSAPGERLHRIEVTIRCGPCAALMAAEDARVQMHGGDEADDSFRATMSE